MLGLLPAVLYAGTGREVELDEEAKLGEVLLFLYFPFLSLYILIILETEIKDEKKFVSDLNKEVNDLSDRMISMQNSSDIILQSLSMQIASKFELIKEVNKRISKIQTRLEKIQTRKEGFSIQLTYRFKF